MKSYLDEILEITKEFKPDAIIAERYMSRRMGGTTIELVNMALGALRVFCITNDVYLRMIPASQWKNELKRRGVDLKLLYKQVRMANKKTPHEVDAVFIALYAYFIRMGAKAFEVEDPIQLGDAVVKKIGALKLSQ
jgi:hypothetical protein